MTTKADSGQTGGAQTVRNYLPVALATLALIAGGAYWLSILHQRYPIQHWLFWRYAIVWLCSLTFAAACLCAGHELLTRVFRAPRLLDSHLVHAFALGLFVYSLLVFLLGLVGLLNGFVFFMIPAIPLALGGRSTWRHLRRRGARLHRLRRPASAWTIVASLVGLAGCALVYFPILNPENVAYDARWYHLALAEHYAASGAVTRFAEGWVSGAIPQLSSYLYTWAFLTPMPTLFDKVELAAHLEFVVFLFTLLSIPVLVRALIRRAVPWAWAGLFLFPGIFVYDSSLTAAADHIVAVWCVPIFITLLRTLKGCQPRDAAELGVYVTGAAMTKYTAASVLALPLAALVVGYAWRALRHFREPRPRSAQWLKSAGVFLGVGAALSSPHWLKNWVWYGDPMYPLLHRLLPAHPWHEDSAVILEKYKSTVWAPKGSVGETLPEALKTLWDFSFIHHDWPAAHGNWPVFGSLFTLSILALPFLRGTRRIWLLVAGLGLGLLTWFYTNHQDRYLQSLLPWFSGVAVALMILAWQRSNVLRFPVTVLVALQLIWGGDHFFIPSHAMIPGKSVVTATSNFLAGGYLKDYTSRLWPMQPYSSISKDLPEDAKVLVHEFHLQLGLGVPRVVDSIPGQYGINYGRLGTPGAVHDKLAELGITHLLVTPKTSVGYDSLASDLVFWDYVSRASVQPKRYGHLSLAKTRAPTPPAPKEPGDVGAFLCSSAYPPGVYDLLELGWQPQGGRATPRTPWAGKPDELRALLAKVRYIAWERKCHPELARVVRAYKKIATRLGVVDLYVNKKQ